MKIHFSKYFIYDSVRFYLGIVFLVYAKNKLLQDQFLVDPSYLEYQLKDIPIREVAWYVYGKEPFNIFIGISELITALLLFIRKTSFIGAILFLIIISNVLMINISYMVGWEALLMISKVVYLGILSLYLIYFNKKKLLPIYKSSMISHPKFSNNLNYFFFLFLGAILLNILSIFPKYLYYLVMSPNKILEFFMADLKNSYYIYEEIVKRYF